LDFSRRFRQAFFLVEPSAFAKFVGNVHQNPTQNLVAAPSLKTTRFVVRIALAQHVPLRADRGPFQATAEALFMDELDNSPSKKLESI
jgi:hypothetical protein